MSVPAIAALAIFQFLFVWNDLLVALIYIGASNPENLPMTVAIANLVNSLGGGWQLSGRPRSSRWRCRWSSSSRSSGTSSGGSPAEPSRADRLGPGGRDSPPPPAGPRVRPWS